MTNPLYDIREGMNVLDRFGNRIGSVDWVKMTDENAETETETVEQVDLDDLAPDHPNLLDILAETFRVDAVPDALRQKLLRRGFVRLDADGLFASDRYVLPEQITTVIGNEVILNVEKNELIKPH